MGPLARLTLLVAALPSLALGAAPERMPKIKSIQFSGSGCPNDPKWMGTFDNLVVTYDQFDSKFPSVSANQACQVHIQGTGGSPGWQVALKETWVTGHLYLQPGTNLQYITTSYFSQDAAKTNAQKGERSNDSKRSTDEDVVLYNDLSKGLVWSPCFGADGYTGIMNVNLRTVLSGDGRAGFEAHKSQWRLEWRRC